MPTLPTDLELFSFTCLSYFQKGKRISAPISDQLFHEIDPGDRKSFLGAKSLSRRRGRILSFLMTSFQLLY